MHLGLDLGTSGLKGLLVKDNQQIVGEATSSLNVTRLHDGWSEQDPDQWINATEDILNQLAKSFGLSKLRSIGLSGQMQSSRSKPP